MYRSFKCNKCGTEFQTETRYITEMESKGRFMACIFGHKSLREIDRYAGVEQVMRSDSHCKEGGKVVQKTWG